MDSGALRRAPSLTALAMLVAACADQTPPPLVPPPPPPVVAAPPALPPPPPAPAPPPAASAAPDPPEAPPPPPTPPPKLARGDGTPADKAIDEGDTAFAKNDFAAAEKAYRRAASLAPKDAAPIVGAARALAAKAEVPTDVNAAPRDPTLLAIVRELGRAIKLDEDFAPAHLELGRALLVLGKAGEAFAELKRAVELSPGDAEAHSALGVAHLALGRLSEATRELARAAELAPGDADRYTNLGTALLAAGTTEDAVL